MYTLITGATSGIGEAIANVLGEKGHDLILVGRNESKLKSLKNSISKAYNVKVQACIVDMTEVAQINRMIQWIKEEAFEIDVFVNNAGLGDFGPFFESKTTLQMEMIDVNIKGFTYLLKEIEPYLVGEKRILQVASTAAFAPGPYMSVYYATKAYVLSFSMALKHEVKHRGIKISILCPGPTKTAFQQKAHMQKSGIANWVAMSPEKVADIACKALFEEKILIIPGIFNKISVMAMMLMPMGMAAKMVACTQKK